jgi:porphobilinogen synthase
MSLHSGLSHSAHRAWTEPHIHPSQLIYPLFVTSRATDNPIKGLEPNVQWGCGANCGYATLIAHLREMEAKGLRSVMLFGVVDDKNSHGYMADVSNTPVIACSRALRQALPNLLIACDVCLCEYTDHGHCGLLREVDGEDVIDNEKTVARLAEIGLAYARAGAHMLCPSDMMDNRIAAIRKKLNENGFPHVSLMAYTSKKASCMYAPFRDAVESTFKGNRNRYQHPIGSLSHALLAYDRDVNEGADSVIVKPSLFYGDLVKELSAKKLVPVACYVVSGEYKMLSDYGKSTGSLEAVVREAHLGLLRAGASILITYFTPFILDRVAKW